MIQFRTSPPRLPRAKGGAPTHPKGGDGRFRKGGPGEALFDPPTRSTLDVERGEILGTSDRTEPGKTTILA
ncbi:MAG: hypothetical protein CM15mP128_2560 [Methanobacteriota archaeon]|nr:MAG: hypothetical protein CM15mP128_2560 [Euryarchaeota archaeon]